MLTASIGLSAASCESVEANGTISGQLLTGQGVASRDAAPPVGIAGQVTQYEIRWGAMSAGGILAMVPILVFAFAVQRYLVRGLSLGAVKG